MENVTSDDILEVAYQLYNREELMQMAEEQRETLFTVICANLEVANEPLTSKQLADLKDRFENLHSHPALMRLQKDNKNEE